MTPAQIRISARSAIKGSSSDIIYILHILQSHFKEEGRGEDEVEIVLPFILLMMIGAIASPPSWARPAENCVFSG
jgi:hypothetical protein